MSDQYPPPPPGPPGPPPPPPPYGSPYGGPPPAPQWDVTAAIGYGWRKFADNWAPFLVVGLLACGSALTISMAGSLVAYGGRLSAPVEPDASFVDFWMSMFHPVETVFSILGQVVAMVFSAALIRGAFDAVEGRKVELGAMFTRWSFLHVVLAAVLVSVMIGVGLVACILPGIALAFFTWFTTYFIVGDRDDAIAGIKSSFRFVAREPGKLLLLALLSFLVIVAGICACGVGVLVAVPVVTIAAAYTMRVLQGQPVAP